MLVPGIRSLPFIAWKELFFPWKYLLYEGCPESIRPFWISREPVEWPWCNLAASQIRPFCASVNIHSPVGLVSRQWDAVDWACVLRDRRIHNDQASRSASSRQCPCPLYSSRVGFFFGKASHHTNMCICWWHCDRRKDTEKTNWSVPGLRRRNE